MGDACEAVRLVWANESTRRQSEIIVLFVPKWASVIGAIDVTFNVHRSGESDS